MRVIAIIPARMGSSRFPGKPLAPLLGRPMIEHVFRGVVSCETVAETYIATCDEEIRKAAEQFGARVVMTSSDHERASDRVSEAADRIEQREGKSDIVVMLQGDEPLITAPMIEAAIVPIVSDRDVQCVNLVKRIRTDDELLDPNTIKVVMNLRNEALYFSRAPIGGGNKANNKPIFKQVCVIPFRRHFLTEFAKLSPTPLEQSESIDMLRVLEHGKRIHLVETDVETHAVDTPDDLALVERLMNGK